MEQCLVEYREMAAAEIVRIREVNREELIEAEYVAEPDGSGFGIVTRLRRLDLPVLTPAWAQTAVNRRIDNWKPHLDRGGCMYGAFHAGRLVGFVILGLARADHAAEVVALFIDSDFRCPGIGAALMQWAEQKSRQLGIEALYLYANPTESSVNFYTRMGFQITGLIAKTIVKQLPGDIVMAKRIAGNKSPTG